MIKFDLLAMIVALSIGICSIYVYSMGARTETKQEPLNETSIHDFKITTLYRKGLDLNQFKGKPILIVNTASYCGYTNQYEELQTLYTRYKEKGFSIIGFPANNFMGQEPKSNDEIQQFCSSNFGVSFPMSEKISVKGADIHPIYRFLTEKETNKKHSGKISWNFNKFLIGPNGQVYNRYGSSTRPLSTTIVNDIETLLK